jgi:exosortase H (IPTLxxWG-CTERM-specific)
VSNHGRNGRRRELGAPGGDRGASAKQTGSSTARITWRFCVGFLLLVSLFSWLASSRPSSAILHEPLTRLLASLAVPVLAVFGNAVAYGNDLVFRGFRATIEGACDGVQPTYIYIAAVLAFPSRWRAKVWGILLGIPAIFLINFVRIATVMVCGAYSPKLFVQVHLYGWQALVIALTLAVWLFWAELFVRRGGPSPA